MRQYLLNDDGILNAGKSLPRERSECFGYYLSHATADSARLNINIEVDPEAAVRAVAADALEELRNTIAG